MTRRSELTLFGLVAAFALAMVVTIGLQMLEPKAYRRHAPRPAWSDQDHDCQNTRQEILIRDCAVVLLSPNRCKVTEATCFDLYTGIELATDTPAQSIQVDHLFPQSVARVRWPGARLPTAAYPYSFSDFYNDSLNLQAVRSRTNQRKGDKMPQQWCPGDPAIRPLLAQRFEDVAEKYGLELTPDEWSGLHMWRYGQCAPGAVVIGESAFPASGSD